MTQKSDRHDYDAAAKDDTNPFGRTIYKPKNKFLRWAIWFAMVAIVVLGLTLIFRVPSADLGPNVLPANASKKPKPPLSSPSIKDRLAAQLLINEITAMEKVARQDKKQLLELLGQLSEKSAIDTRAWDFANLSSGQMDLLHQRAHDGDARASDYLVQLDKYQALQNRIRGLEANLGSPELVTSGDTHFQIASNFLIAQAGKTDAEALQILLNTQFQEPLLPGFKVWNFWLEDKFCTFVTQGTAPLTPEEAALQEKERAMTRLNSIFYIVGSNADLKERKILSGGFLKSTRMGEIAPGQFQLAIDLRNQQHLRISAAALQMKKISRLEIFPRVYSSGRDYTVRLDPRGRWAQIIILKKEIFRGRRIVIACE